MSYQNIYFYRRQELEGFKIFLPIIFGLIFFFIVFFSRMLFFDNLPTIKADQPRLTRHILGNLNQTQATIYWRTSKPTKSWLVYGNKKENLNKIVYDQRETASTLKKRFDHFVNLGSLEPGKTYFYRIIVDGQIIKPINKTEFSFTTLSHDKKLINFVIANGKVISPSGQPVNEGIVVIRDKENNYFLGRLGEKGEWLVTLFYENMPRSQVFLIEIINEEGLISSILADKSNLNPLPELVILGKNYDFLGRKDRVLGINEEKNIQKKIQDFEVVYPKEKAVIPGRRPLVKGEGLPGEVIFINFKGRANLRAQVKTDNSGLWEYQLPRDLPTGTYQVDFTSKNSEGKIVTITRNFFLGGQTGSSVLGEATRSATVTSVPTITPTAYPTSSPTPTIEVKITSLVTPSPTTVFETPTLTIQQPTTSQDNNYPQAGNQYYFLTFIGWFFIITGLIVLIINKIPF